MIRNLIVAALVLIGVAVPAAAQTQSIAISGLPVATAPNPQTDYAVGIVQQVNPAGVPFFVTARVPLSRLVGPAGASPLLTGVNVTTLAPGASPSGNIGGAFPNYVVNLSLPAGPANVLLGQGAFTPGDLLAVGSSGFGVVDLGSSILPPARLPAPTATTPGGVQALPAASNLFLTGIGLDGRPTAAQPSFGNLAGSAMAAQMPAFTGDVVTSAGSTATTLATTGVSPGSYVLPTVTIDAKGRATAASQGSLSGDVATTAGSLVTAIQPGTVTNAKMASAPALTIKGNAAGSVGTVFDLTVAQSKALLGFASSGSNSDITALSGLITALSPAQGGTGSASLSGGLDTAFGQTQGSVLYRGASGWATLAPGASGQVLGTGGSGANPAWQNAGGNGTVTSVSLSLPSSLFTVSGSPVTSSGTLTGALATQAPNAVLAGPASGAGAAPTFRALVPSDEPAAMDGCVRLSVTSNTALKLSPYGCSTLSVGGAAQVMPGAGVTLSGPSVTASTAYYVYATASGGGVSALTLSTTGHVTGADGREYLSSGGTAVMTSRLVGMVYVNSQSQFSQALNWFNRRPLAYSAVISGSTNSTTNVQGAGSVSTLAWAGEVLGARISRYVSNNTAGGGVNVLIYTDNASGTQASAGVGTFGYSPVATAQAGVSAEYVNLSATEGYNTATVWCSVPSSSTSGTLSVYLTVQTNG